MRLGATGLSGVLGRNLKNQLPEVDWVPFTGDVGDSAALARWYDGAGRLDGIIHLAAVVPLRQVEADLPAAVRTNVEGTCNILKAVVDAKKEGTHRPWFFLASTSHVYKSSSAPLAEAAPLGPENAYGLTKLQAEGWAEFYALRHDLDVCIGRIFSYSAPEQPESYFIPAIIRKLSNAPPRARLEIPGLSGTRDFLTPDLICNAISVLLRNRATGVYNIGTGNGLALLDIVRAVQERLNRNDLVIVPGDEGTIHLRADASKLRGLGVVLRLNLPALIERMIPPHTAPPSAPSGA